MRSDRSDADVERILEHWLEDHAAPLPARLGGELADVPAHHTQRGSRGRMAGAWQGWRAATTGVSAILVVTAIVAAPALIGELRSRLGSAAPSAPPPATETYEWDALLNFLDRNPARDAYGHDVVWSYLYGHAGDPDPTRYLPLSAYQAEPMPRWYQPTIEGLYLGTSPGGDLLQMHPAAGGGEGRSPILAWRSPIDETSLTITGTVEVDGSCGDGITFRVDHAGDTFRSIDLQSGRERFSIPVERLVRGGIIHFIVDPREDSRCDTTWVSILIEAP